VAVGRNRVLGICTILCSFSKPPAVAVGGFYQGALLNGAALRQQQKYVRLRHMCSARTPARCTQVEVGLSWKVESMLLVPLLGLPLQA
jgi:hypothetical protein